MQGRRVPAAEYGWAPHPLEPGDYVLVTPTAMADGSPLAFPHEPYWMMRTPNGHYCSISTNIHKVVEHEDGTITVSPSILVSSSVNGVRVEVWHGFLERGVWRTV